MSDDELLTSGQVAIATGELGYKVTRAAAEGLIRPTQVIGRLRLFRRADLPQIRAALQKRFPAPAVSA